MSDLIFTVLSFTKPSLESAEQIFGLSDVVKIISKNSFEKFDNTQRKTDVVERRNFTHGFPAFSNVMIMATLEIFGQIFENRVKDELNRDSNSWRTKGPSDLRKDGAKLSGSATPLLFIFLMADNNSSI